MSSSWSSASLCPEPNELLQPIRTMPWVCAGLRLGWCTEPPFTPRPAWWAGGGCGPWGNTGGGRFDSPQSGHCQPPNQQRLHREPQYPGAHLAPIMGTLPVHTGTRPSPWVEEGCSFIHSAANSAKVGSAHVGLATKRKRLMQRDKEGKATISLSHEQ